MEKGKPKENFAEIFQQADIMRLVIVGGTSRACCELRERLRGSPVRLKTVDGTRRVSRAEARHLTAAADLVVIWAWTPLHHSVAHNFKSVTPKGKRMYVSRRGVDSLLQEIVDFLERRETTSLKPALTTPKD